MFYTNCEMKYSILLILSVLLIPIVSQSAYAQNIVDDIGEAFNDLTSGLMGDNNTNESSTNVSSSTNTGNQSTNGTSNANSNSNSTATGNQSESNQSSSKDGIGSIQELQNLTTGNQQLLENGSSISNNVSLLQGMEKSQLGDSVVGNQDAKFEGSILDNATSR
jgi:hypothetical protein